MHNIVEIVAGQKEGFTTRKDFDPLPWTEFPFAEGKIVLHQNYGCHSPYCDDQVIEYVGLCCIFYGPGDTRFQQASRTVRRTDAETMPAILEALRQEALSKCSHEQSVQIRNTGRCLNVWRCKDCGDEYEVDSSD